VDPTDPCFVISNPDPFAAELAQKIGGPYYTLGIPEDTKPLNEEMIDDDAFISMCDDIMTEREKMLRYGLETFSDGVFSFVIDTTDRIQHIYWRFEDEGHPLFDAAEKKKYGNVIRDYYVWVDRLVKEITTHHVDDKTLFLICSDHGFTTYRKGVHLNRWLIDRGYMTLSEELDPEDLEGGALFRHVDWNETAAYSLGFSSIYLNLSGREGKGKVDASEAKDLKKKIAKDLASAKDPDTGEKIVRAVYNARDIYSQHHVEDAPDLVVGFEVGYRMSWQTAIGGTPRGLTELNLKKWSGDHIVDPSIVPGIFFSNEKVKKKTPRGIDIAPTVLRAFGIKGDKDITGESLI
jgi:predicted AlkP superfamily phosphohydrolase/phosphomutase